MRSLRGLLRHVASRAEKPLYVSGIFSARRLVLPDFLGIGAMKSGTTWLYENLRCHPDIFVPDRKELYYFSHGFHEGRLRRYSACFEPGADKIKGEITPGYATVPRDRIRFIRRVMPDVKLIFIARDPVDRSWSEAYMNLVVKAGRQISAVSDEAFIEYLTSSDCQRRSDYVQILDSWHSVFPPSQLFLGTLDEIRCDPREFLTRLFRFLGTAVDVDWALFPAADVVVPRYEPNRMVYRGDVAVDRHCSRDLMPRRIHELLRQMYLPEIERLGEKYGFATQQWQ